jgi:two-component system, OmpR family, phosphate regulon response regulator PhoB
MAKNVMIVDDDPDVRMFNIEVVKQNGYHPVAAKNGEDAMAQVKESRPDLVVLDVLMPKQSGIKMYRELKTDESLKDIPVIILSGIDRRTFIRSQEALTQFGDENVPEPDIYLEKPTEPWELAEAIKKLLE